MLRGEILTALANFGHDETLSEANRRFQAFLEDRKTPLLSPDIRKVVACELYAVFKHSSLNYLLFTVDYHFRHLMLL